MTRPRHLRTARHGFTLVELMVATALVVLILTILAVAFGAASESLSSLKAMGDMATKLRTTQDRFKSDVESQHFEPGDSPGPLRLADVRYDWLGTANAANVQVPRDGFFRIENGATPTVGSKYEGQDGEGLLSTRADGTTGHAIEFTSKLQGRTPDDLFVVPFGTAALANLSATDTPLNNTNLFASKWARVRWQLGTQQDAGGVPVWTLYRCVRVIAQGNTNTPINVALTTVNDPHQFAHLNNTTETLRDLNNPANRTGALPGAQLAPYAAGTPFYGDDIVLTNVTSFEIKPMWESGGGGIRSPRQNLPILSTAYGTAIPDGIPGVGVTPPFPSTPNSDLPFDDLPASTLVGNPRVFDTWNDVNTLPLRIRVTALQVKIRVFDPKTLRSRQVSFIVQP